MPLVVFHLVRHMFFLIMMHPVFLQLRLLRALMLLVWALLSVPSVHACAHKTACLPAFARPCPVMPRCCTRIEDEFAPSYSSVLVFGSDPRGLEDAVMRAEQTESITSCFTAWCSRCRGPYLVSTDIAGFPCPSAHHTHKLVLLAALREAGALPPRRAV